MPIFSGYDSNNPLSEIAQHLFYSLGEEPGSFTPGNLPVYDLSSGFRPANMPDMSANRLTGINTSIGPGGSYTLYQISGPEKFTGEFDPESNQPITTSENLGYVVGPPQAPERDRGFFGGLASSLGSVLKEVPILPMAVNMVAPGYGSALTVANAVANKDPLAALAGIASLAAPAVSGTDAATAASDLAKIEASMGVPSVLSQTLPAIPQVVETPAGILSPEAQMMAPTVFNEPVLQPSTALTGTFAQPPLAVENIASQLTPEAQGLLSPSYATVPIPPEVVETPASLLSPEAKALMTGPLATGPLALGSAAKAALYGASGYGPGLIAGEAPIIESVPTSVGPGKEVTPFQIAKDIVTSLPGAAQQYATTALTTLGIDPDIVNKLVGANVKTSAATTTQQGAGILGPVLGGLLSKPQVSAPTPGLIQGRQVDITSPITSLLAPKLVQQRPIVLR